LSDVIRNVDPYGMYFPFYFGHEFLVTNKQGMFKDLKKLNRKLNKIVAVDFENDYMNSNNNAIYLKKYSGETDDKELKILTLFLTHLAQKNVKDVRKEIQKYGGFESALKNYEDEM